MREALNKNELLQQKGSQIEKAGRKFCEKLNSQVDIINPDEKLRVLALKCIDPRPERRPTISEIVADWPTIAGQMMH